MRKHVNFVVCFCLMRQIVAIRGLKFAQIELRSKWQLSTTSIITRVPWSTTPELKKGTNPITLCASRCSLDQNCEILELMLTECVLHRQQLVQLAPENATLEALLYQKIPEGYPNLGQNLESNLAVLIFRQDCSDGIYWPRGIVGMNKNSPEAKLFSLLDDIESYRGRDGHFHFKLCYPDLHPNDCFRWSQSENPFLVTGMKKPKDFSFKGGPTPRDPYFWGLSNSTPNDAILDADLKSAREYWFALGTFEAFTSRRMPGPRRVTVSIVELYCENLL